MKIYTLRKTDDILLVALTKTRVSRKRSPHNNPLNATFLDLSKSSISRNLALRSSSLRRPRNRQSLKLRQKASILPVESTRRNEDITLAHATEVLLSSASSSVIRAAVELALEVGDNDLLDVLEDISFKKTLAGGVAFDGVAVDVAPDVVDGVEEGGG